MKYYDDPANREKHSQAQKKRWKDPQYRANVMAGLKRFWSSPAGQEHKRLTKLNNLEHPRTAERSETAKKIWARPGYREKMAIIRGHQFHPKRPRKTKESLKPEETLLPKPVPARALTTLKEKPQSYRAVVELHSEELRQIVNGAPVTDFFMENNSRLRLHKMGVLLIIDCPEGITAQVAPAARALLGA